MKFTDLTHRASSVVATIQRQLPEEIQPWAAGVPVHFQPRPDAGVLAEGFAPDILGLFSGNPLGTEISYSDPAPPHILLYLDNLWAVAAGDPAAFAAEVRRTYLHELGHYLGWDEDDLAARGLD